MLLFINTASGKEAMLALMADGRVLASRTGPARNAKRDALLITIEQLLRRTRRKLADLQVVVVVEGPGPFSALRAGITTANALAFGLGIPVVGVSDAQARELTAFAAGAQALVARVPRGAYVVPAYGAEPNISKPVA